jgi:ABC-2 type transport system ATP-binding protein
VCPVAERQSRYRRLLDMTGLGAYTRRIAGALSGGMKQKLGLACCLIKSPEMLLLDEPTVGVDPVSRRELWTIVYELVDQDGIGVLLSTAYLDEAERCSRVVVLHHGEVLAEGTPAQFKSTGQPSGSTADATGRGQTTADPDRFGQPGYDRGCHDPLRSCPCGGCHAMRIRMHVTADLPPSRRPSIERVAPTFEDAFMALIPKSSALRQPMVTASRRPRHRSWETCQPGQNGRSNGDEATALLKRFGDFEAVKHLTFDVHRGEIFGLLGPNGAGKSTTFRMLCGLLKATGGDIQVAGRDLRRSPARARARLGYMAQQFSLYRQISVLENLKFYGRAYGLDKTCLGRRIEWAFTEFDLYRWKDHAAGSLPGGYKQRLAMAVALLHEPEILFLDEPTSGVDPLARREFWLRINGFAQQGMTVVVTTHFMEESEYCDRMLIMSRGEKLALGTPEEIRTLARTADNPDPTVEEAFVALATGEVNQ